MSRLVTDVQGKHIAFVGDRSNGHYPVPFIPPQKNVWVWKKAKYLCNTSRFGTFYDNEDNRDKLWLAGASEAELMETLLPCLLVLPTFITAFLGKQGGPCLAHKLQKFVSDHIGGGELQVPPDKWQLVLDKCLAAAQGGNNGLSILNLGSLEPALCQDSEFFEWCELRLNTTLEQEPQLATGQYNGGGGWQPTTGQTNNFKHGTELHGWGPSAGTKQLGGHTKKEGVQ